MELFNLVCYSRRKNHQRLTAYNRKIKENNLVSGRIRTHDLLVTCCVLKAATSWTDLLQENRDELILRDELEPSRDRLVAGLPHQVQAGQGLKVETGEHVDEDRRRRLDGRRRVGGDVVCRQIGQPVDWKTSIETPIWKSILEN